MAAGGGHEQLVSWARGRAHARSDGWGSHQDLDACRVPAPRSFGTLAYRRYSNDDLAPKVQAQ